jgi:hypothetical protein
VKHTIAWSQNVWLRENVLEEALAKNAEYMQTLAAQFEKVKLGQQHVAQT